MKIPFIVIVSNSVPNQVHQTGSVSSKQSVPRHLVRKGYFKFFSSHKMIKSVIIDEELYKHFSESDQPCLELSTDSEEECTYRSQLIIYWVIKQILQ